MPYPAILQISVKLLRQQSSFSVTMTSFNIEEMRLALGRLILLAPGAVLLFFPISRVLTYYLRQRTCTVSVLLPHSTLSTSFIECPAYVSGVWKPFGNNTRGGPGKEYA